MSREAPQVNVRLTDAQDEVLRAAAFVKGCGKKDLAKEALLTAIDRYAKEDAVKIALRARRIEASGDGASVTRISAGRKGKQSKKKRA